MYNTKINCDAIVVRNSHKPVLLDANFLRDQEPMIHFRNKFVELKLNGEIVGRSLQPSTALDFPTQNSQSKKMRVKTSDLYLIKPRSGITVRVIAHEKGLSPDSTFIPIIAFLVQKGLTIPNNLSIKQDELRLSIKSDKPVKQMINRGTTIGYLINTNENNKKTLLLMTETC